MNEAIFGGFDGLTSVLGVIAAAYTSGNMHLLVVASLCLAIAAAVSMAGGEFLSETTGKAGGMHRAGIMAGATFIGAFLPAVPFLFLAKPLALGTGIVLVFCAAVVIAQMRVATHGIVRAYVQTFGVLFVAAGLSVGASLLFNLV